MLLLTAATDVEMAAFSRAWSLPGDVARLVTGIGPVEAAVELTAYLARFAPSMRAVVNFGVAGAYLDETPGHAGLLDICLAEREVLGDLGICCADDLEPLRGDAFAVHDSFILDAGLLHRAAALLASAAIPYKRGVFVTVNCVSGTLARGRMLARHHQALCENMEGAAVARACQRFGVPLLELRCISNLVEDRDTQNWQLRQACARCGEAVALVAQGLLHG